VTQLEDITAGYQQLSASYVQDAGEIASSSFRNLGQWRDEDIFLYIEQISPPLSGIKRNASTSAIAYHEKFAQLSNKSFTRPSLDDLDLSTSALRNGVNVKEVYSRPFVQMRMALAKGDSFTDALSLGSRTADSFARTEIQLSRRQASLFARRANDNIVGFLRTLSGNENCALCYVASTQRYNKGDLLPIHPACDCGEMPIYGDSDPGQVIDQQLLDKSHEAVGQRFGIDVGGRNPDYRKITIHDHGEMGPMLTVKGQKFTGPNDLDLVGKKMPKPKPLPPVTDRIREIRKKAYRIDGTQMVEDINNAQFARALKASRSGEDFTIKTNRKNVSFGATDPVANKYLDDVLALGKDVDDELSIRIKSRLDKVNKPDIDVKAVNARLAALDELINKKNAEKTAVKSKIQAEILADFEKSAEKILGKNERSKILDAVDKFKASPENKAALAKRLDKQKPLLDRIQFDITELKLESSNLRRQLDEVIAPGSKAFDTIMVEEATKLIDEIRGTSTTTPVLTGPDEVVKIVENAFSKYPKDWAEAAKSRFPGGIKTNIISRGEFRDFRDGSARISLSVGKNRLDSVEEFFPVAVHEVGHAMEQSVPGLKRMESAYWQRRAASDNYKITGIVDPQSRTEFGNRDKWTDAYTGRSYGLKDTDGYEVFTTGIEALLGGNNYFGDSTLGQTVDDDFRRFILGVLIGL